MLEWICPKCSRNVDPAFIACPFCGYQEGAAQAAPAAPVQRPLPAAARPGRRVILRRKREWQPFWADVERGFRFGLGFIASVAVIYFVLSLIAHYGGYGEWANELARWLFG